MASGCWRGKRRSPRASATGPLAWRDLASRRANSRQGTRGGAPDHNDLALARALLQHEGEAGKMANNHRVIIVGGGFGGLRAAQAFKGAPVDVTLIDKRNFNLFQPLLYQVATGSLSPGEIAAPLRGVLGRQENTRVLLGDVVDIDPASKTVRLADGAQLEYDSLIVAAGSQTSYFGHDGWREWAPSLKSVEEATGVRHKIFYAFEVAERASDLAHRRCVAGAKADGFRASRLGLRCRRR